MILHRYVEQVMTMSCRRMTALTFILSELFPLDGFRNKFVNRLVLPDCDALVIGCHGNQNAKKM